MLLEIKFNIGRKFTEDEKALLLEAKINNEEVTFKEDGTLDQWYASFIVSAEVAKKFNSFEVTRCIDNTSTKSIGEFTQRDTIIQNTRCEVAVPGLGLLLIDEVEVRTDYCTEMLQESLDEGWKILAICVQPDQRRPDYILGRSRQK